ncbi:hypothetical protein D3C87_1950060 [compost metagenome]
MRPLIQDEDVSAHTAQTIDDHASVSQDTFEHQPLHSILKVVETYLHGFRFPA